MPYPNVSDLDGQDSIPFDGSVRIEERHGTTNSTTGNAEDGDLSLWTLRRYVVSFADQDEVFLDVPNEGNEAVDYWPGTHLHVTGILFRHQDGKLGLAGVRGIRDTGIEG